MIQMSPHQNISKAIEAILFTSPGPISFKTSAKYSTLSPASLNQTSSRNRLDRENHDLPSKKSQVDGNFEHGLKWPIGSKVVESKPVRLSKAALEVLEHNCLPSTHHPFRDRGVEGNHHPILENLIELGPLNGKVSKKSKEDLSIRHN